MDTSNNERISTKTQKKAMLQALEATLGVVTAACIECGIERKTHYRWMKSDPKYAAAVDDIQNIAIDFAESKLHQQIRSNNTTATIFFLKTKGKNRGYIERTELTGPDGKELQTGGATYVLPDGTKVEI